MVADDLHHLLEQRADLHGLSRTMKIIAHPLRLKILCTLGPGQFSVLDIVDKIGASQSNTSQHLAILRQHGILDTRKNGNRIFYSVADKRTLGIVDMMRSVFCPR